MTPQERIQALEMQLPVDDIKVRNLPIWPIIKPYIFFNLRQAGFTQKLKKIPKQKLIFWGIGQSLSLLGSVFSYLKKCDILISSNSLENREIGTRSRNKIFFEIINTYKQRTSYFERPVFLAPLSKEKGIIPLLPLVVISKVFGRLGKPLVPDEFKAKLKAQGFKVNADRLVHEFFFYRAFWRFTLALKKPKVIFITDYYNVCHLGLIRAAKEKQIPVMEFQHGIITRLHPAYDFPALKDKSFFPDFLGYYILEKDLPSSFYLKTDHIVNVGHPYMSWVFEKPEEVKPTWAMNSKKKVVVTLQYGYFDQVLDFIEKAANELPDVSFIIVPRMPHDEVRSFTQDNVVIERKYNFYQCVPHCDIHTTFSSTCTLEAYLKGIPTILIEINDVSRMYYSQFSLGDTVSYVKTTKEFAEQLFSERLSKSASILPHASDAINTFLAGRIS